LPAAHELQVGRDCHIELCGFGRPHLAGIDEKRRSAPVTEPPVFLGAGKEPNSRTGGFSETTARFPLPLTAGGAPRIGDGIYRFLIHIEHQGYRSERPVGDSWMIESEMCSFLIVVLRRNIS